MKKALTILLCIICMIGCTTAKEDQRVLSEARKELSQIYSGIIYFNSSKDDIIHLCEISNGKEEFYYYHNESLEFTGDIKYNEMKAVDDYDTESYLLEQETRIVCGLICEDIVFDHVSDSSDIKHYYYRIPDEVMQKYQLQGEYRVIVVVYNKQIINIRLIKEEGNHYEYFLNIIVDQSARTQD